MAVPEERSELRRRLLAGTPQTTPEMREADDLRVHADAPEVPAGAAGDLRTGDSVGAPSFGQVSGQPEATPMPNTIELRPDVERVAKGALVAAVEQRVLTELRVAQPEDYGGKPSRRERRAAKRPKQVRFADHIDLDDEVLVLGDVAESLHAEPGVGAVRWGAAPDPHVTYVVRESTPLRTMLTVLVWMVVGAGLA
ncbi:MAG: hypothetical protein WA797_03760, partial [Acidimicrobiales bacterium]